MSDPLRDVLRYKAETGEFYWKNRPGLAGKKAGSLSGTGYLSIKVYGKSYLIHRLVWYFETGSWPLGVIDHRDRNKINNKFSNLRDTNQSVNGLNQGIRSNNTTGVKGVQAHQGRWMVRKSGCYIGMFGTLAEAKKAYEEYHVGHS